MIILTEDHQVTQLQQEATTITAATTHQEVIQHQALLAHTTVAAAVAEA